MTNAVLETLARLVADLDSLDVGWALVGGLAVSTRVEPRFTRDVDVVVVAGSDGDAEQVILRLQGLGYGVASLVEQEYLGRLATVRLLPPSGGGVVVDLLFASSGVEPEIVAGAERLEILPGLVVPVALSGHLVVLKLLAQESSRPQDAMDLHALRGALTSTDAAEVRRLAAEIVSRGFHRERDLIALAEEYLSHGVGPAGSVGSWRPTSTTD